LFGLPLSISDEQLVQIEPTQRNGNDHQFWDTAGALLTMALSGQPVTEPEVSIRRSDDDIPLIASAVPIYADDHRVVGAVGVFQDARPFREVKMLRELDQLKSELIANISHDLGTPLHLIRGCATTLLQGNASLDRATSRLYLDTIVEESDKLGRLIQDLLDASRIEHGTLRLRIGSVEFDRILEQAVRHWRAVGSHRFELHISDEVPPIPGDAHRLTQVVDNLLANAARYTAEQTLIEVELQVNPDALIFSIRDHGPGVSPEHLPHLFDRFYQAGSAAQRHDKGSGLGLFICKGIVDQHGGRIWAEPTPGSGLTFRVCLPRRYKATQALMIEPSS
jgi:signal transduction histidine kinase